MKPCTKFDVAWILGLFGTAVGAGILFLPINAGMAGFWPLVAMTIVVGPMIFYAHQGLQRFVLSSSQSGRDITEAAEEHFGPKGGMLVTFLYFFAIYPILPIYGVGLTNTASSFLVNQMGWEEPPRAVLSLILVAAMMAVMISGEKLMLRASQVLVYPLCGILLFLSLLLIPHWDFGIVKELPSAADFVSTLWITIPVLVFAFNHSPAISSFALSQQREYGAEAEVRGSLTLWRTAALLTAFVMLFVFSCVLSLTPADLLAAKEQNISILSYLANTFDNPLVSYLGPLVAFLAIGSSFFGHYLGAREGLHGLVVKVAHRAGATVDERRLKWGIVLFFMASIWIASTLNPSILSMIEDLGGPVFALILFIMPMYAIRTVPAMRRYAGKWSNVFVAAMGLAAISRLLYVLIRQF